MKKSQALQSQLRTPSRLSKPYFNGWYMLVTVTMLISLAITDSPVRQGIIVTLGGIGMMLATVSKEQYLNK